MSITNTKFAQLLDLANQTLKRCKIDSFPADARKLASCLTLTCRTYDKLPPTKRLLYEDRCRLGAIFLPELKAIYYNPDLSNVNEQLMHEIAHYLLGHQADSPENEEEAKVLASFLTYPVNTVQKKNRPSLHIAYAAVIISLVCLFFAWQGLNPSIHQEITHPDITPVTAPITADLQDIDVSSDTAEISQTNNTQIKQPQAVKANTAQAKASMYEQKVPQYDTKALALSYIVYDTPTGRRYHMSRACAGENAFEVTVSQAIQSGKTPCKTCVN